jgi:hypothetical protein
VRVHAALNRVHECYNSFTLCRGYTRSPQVAIILGSWIPIVQMKYPYTRVKCALEIHYKAFQWFHLDCNVPTEVLLLV